MSNWANPHACEYLASLGINPLTVSLDDTHEEGYMAMRLDEDGKRVHCGHCGETRKDYRDWPEGFNFEVLKAKWIEDGHYVFAGHLFHRVQLEDDQEVTS